MNTKKSKKSQNDAQNDSEQLKNDVLAFASSLGLSAPSSALDSGFNDTDFRKTGPLKPLQENPSPPNNKKNQILNPNSSHQNSRKPNSRKPDFKNADKNSLKPNSGRADFKSADKNSWKPNSNAPRGQGDFRNDDRNSWKTTDKFKNLPKLPLVKASVVGVWHVDVVELERKVLGEDGKKVGFGSGEEWKVLVEKKRQLGERLLAQFVNDYEGSRGQSGDIKMLMTTQRSGTAADKVSAFSVLLGDNPVANLRSLDALLGMVTSKVGKRHSLTGFEALQELFVSSLLPDRKLKTLFQRPLNHLPETKDGNSLLLLWYWEDLLKNRYERFVIALEEASKDVLPILKDKALKTIYTLLRNKSEQERRLLTALVNKLGDPANKAASNADFLLLKLLGDHPNMKAVVIDEVDTLLFRPHLGLKAKYHAVNFLSQIQLSHRGDGPKVAKRLIDVYFALYKVLISEASSETMTGKHGKIEKNKANDTIKGDKVDSSSELHVEMDSRLLSALLSGINRAFPYVASNEADDIVEVQTPILFQLVHSRNFNVGVQALILLEKISSKNQIVSDRFYRALYAKLLLPAAMNSSKEELFIGLLLKAMKSDISLKRVAAFCKRLLQVALQQPPQYACGCLFLLSELLKARPPLWNMVLQNESVDDDLEHFEDITEEEEEDKSSPVEKRTTKVKNVVRSNNDINSHNDSSRGESDSSASDSEDGDLEVVGSLNEDGFYDLTRTKSETEERGKSPIPAKDSSLLPGGYNPRHREPSFCNSDAVSWWELTVLASHVHPSVATMARTLLSGANIVYHGNPLQDFTLSSFLDKFMEKKPKKSTWHGAAEIEPAKKLDMGNQLIGPEILSLAEEDVAPEDLVFHKFYSNKMNSSKKLKKKKKKEAEEDDDEEEIIPMDENFSDSDDPSLEEDANYDYDDLDKIVDEDDDDLVDDASDGETDIPLHTADLELDDTDNEDDREVAIGDADDESDPEDSSNKRRKLKSVRRAGASPFASLDEYEDMINKEEENPSEDESTEKRKSKSKKKRPTEDASTEKHKSKSKKKRKTSS